MEERPASVPEKALWSASENEWILAEADGDGEHHGLVKYYRPDGTICCETDFVHGTPHGAFRRFHENGDVSREGEFVEGALEGTNVFLRCEEQTTEEFPQGLGDEVWRAEMDFQQGTIVEARAYDRDGRRCLEDGTPFPEHPDGVPASAHWDQNADLWVEGSQDENHQKTGTWRWWTNEGVLVRELPFLDGSPHGQARFFNADGSLDSKTTFEHGLAHGRYEEWYEAGFFVDESVRYEQGTMTHGEPTGKWCWFTEGGERKGCVVYGPPREEHELMESPVFADESRSAAEWRDIAKMCKSEIRMGELLVAAARSAAQSKNFEALKKLLAGTCKPLSEGAADYVFEQAEGSLAAMCNALIGGALPEDCYRQMAVVLDQREYSRAAWDFIHVAKALAPDRVDLDFTRALIAISLGRVDAAREAADTLAQHVPERGEFLHAYTDVLFPTYDFWVTEEPSTYYDSVPEGTERTVDDFREIIQKYATRLSHIRDALVASGVDPGEPWMVPDLGHLLPDGPVELVHTTVVDEDGDEVANDETLDLSGESIPTLMRAARVEWFALCWACWAAGLNEVALPQAVQTPENFGQAAGMASQRLWRCRDQEVTGGHMASVHEIPSFEWEGMPIEEVPGPLVEMVTFHYAEMQGLFYYLADPSLASPWQDNLRGS